MQGTRVILTGAPGAGKTTVATLLADQGKCVIHEAATALIHTCQAQGEAKPWTRTSFFDQILAQQQKDWAATAQEPGIVYFDRSPLCTLTAAEFMGHTLSAATRHAIDAWAKQACPATHVLYFESLGTLENTAARTLNYADAQRFGAWHEVVYARFGCLLHRVPVLLPSERAAWVLDYLQKTSRVASPTSF